MSEEHPIGFHTEVAQLGLTPADSTSFFGLHRGYPVAFTIRESKPGRDPLTQISLPGSLVLLIQVRHSSPTLALPPATQLRWSDAISAQLQDKKARLTLDDSIVWLVFYDAHDLIRDKQIIQCMNELLDNLIAHDVSPLSDRCELCRNPATERPIFSDGRVVQICEPCFTGQQSARRQESQMTPEAAMKLAFICPFATMIAAGIWAGLWMLLVLLLDWWKGPNERPAVYLPHIFELLVALATALLVAGPIVYLIRLVPGRGSRAGLVGFFCCTVGVFIGEAVFWKWQLFKEVGATPWTLVVQILPRLWFANGIHTVFKMVVAGLAGYFSYQFSRPKSPPLVSQGR